MKSKKKTGVNIVEIEMLVDATHMSFAASLATFPLTHLALVAPLWSYLHYPIDVWASTTVIPLN